MRNLFKNIGPGTLVAAAFIGPGTVTVCTLAGVKFGFTLLWALLLSIVATIILQEMAARLGLVTQQGLAQTVRTQIANPALRALVVILMVSAILIGNAAYEAGNISGGVLGLQTLWPNSQVQISDFQWNYLPWIIGLIAFVLLFIGNYKFIERSLVALVVLMSLSFIITALMTLPSVTDVIQGLFAPRVPEDGWLTVVALVGTTVVPYNLFLHASLVLEKWKGVENLKLVRRDTYISLILGGLVSMAIVVCAAAIQEQEVATASDLAIGLEPLFGSWATYFLSIGLFAAGITSAITAPLAAAYVAKGCFDWDDGLKSLRFRGVWIFILLVGVIIASFGWKPIEVIQFAQVANGILLPVIAAFLLWVANRNNVLGVFRNSKWQNVLGFIIVLLTFLLGIRGLDKVFGFW